MNKPEPVKDEQQFWFVVGPINDELGYEAIKAPDAKSAIEAFMEGYDSDGDILDHNDFQAFMPAKWQGKEIITPADWANSGEGLSYSCSVCREQTNCEEYEGKILDGKLFCAECAPPSP